MAGVCAILLAAGSSRRMGQDKLLLPYRGATVLERSLRALTACPRVDEVLLVVRPGFVPPFDPGRARLVENPRHEEGMGASLRAGVAAASRDTRVFVLALGDMPDLEAPTVEALVSAWSGGILVPRLGGKRGHPVLLDAKYRAEILAITGDRGARELLAAHEPEIAWFDTDDPAILRDVDLPADLGAFRPRVLIKGAGEHATGVAHRLHRCGLPVVMTEIPEPTAVRLAVCFARAVHEGECEVEGVRATRWALDEAGRLDAHSFDSIPVFVDPSASVRRVLRPEVIVDARLLKRNLDNSVQDAALVVGLGPGLFAGRDVHLVVETQRGHDLGRLLEWGEASADTGVPGEIGGYSRERVLRAPTEGLVAACRPVGSHVAVGEIVCRVGSEPVRSAIPGVLRGMVREGIRVPAGLKIGDVDPRGRVEACFTLSDKTRTLSGAVLEAVIRRLGPWRR
jgi:xanthine dehydrogenase accessory factor